MILQFIVKIYINQEEIQRMGVKIGIIITSCLGKSLKRMISILTDVSLEALSTYPENHIYEDSLML